MDKIKEQLVVAYDRQAANRDSSEKQPWKISERDTFLHLLKDHQFNTLLEIGAGPGHDAKFFHDHGLQVQCIDLSPNHVTLCQAKGLPADVMDFTQMSYANEAFDAVWALNCLLHVPKAELPAVLREIRRVIKPGGLFYMGVYGRENSEGVWDDDHYEPHRFFSFFRGDTLRALLKEYFTVQSFQVISHSEALDFQSIVLMK